MVKILRRLSRNRVVVRDCTPLIRNRRTGQILGRASSKAKGLKRRKRR